MSDENRKLAARLADAEKIISLMQAHISGIEKHRVALIEDRDDLVSRANRAEDRAYTLAVAIMGGEDAPGYADSISAEDLASQLKKERMEQSAWVDACIRVERDRADLCMTNDEADVLAKEAIEAAIIKGMNIAVTVPIEQVPKAIAEAIRDGSLAKDWRKIR